MAAPERSPHPAGALDAAGGRLRADAPPEVRGGENLLRVLRRKASSRRAASNPASWSSESALPCDDSPLERRTCPVALLLRGCGPTVGVSVEAVLVGLL